ncbi:hypothetical protein [Streptomyces sp. DHE17-7]|uniref:hypothetical protein n=1 Tax=Streptomyces sp. DHE17-7 TaxID=2759949 RepID=UPI0022EB65DB|nr:hypothetical protein [Streptomyces sp. DHE17-7]MBJ6623607.1 hypothetical protein [Streptomyces sp. DHE17-7]
MPDRPKTRAAKNLKLGDWVEFGGMAYRVNGAPEPDDDGTVFLPIGPSGTEMKADARVVMHYED